MYCENDCDLAHLFESVRPLSSNHLLNQLIRFYGWLEQDMAIKQALILRIETARIDPQLLETNIQYVKPIIQLQIHKMCHLRKMVFRPCGQGERDVAFGLLRRFYTFRIKIRIRTWNYKFQNSNHVKINRNYLKPACSSRASAGARSSSRGPFSRPNAHCFCPVPQRWLARDERQPEASPSSSRNPALNDSSKKYRKRKMKSQRVDVIQDQNQQLPRRNRSGPSWSCCPAWRTWRGWGKRPPPASHRTPALLQLPMKNRESEERSLADLRDLSGQDPTHYKESSGSKRQLGPRKE